MKPVFRKAVIGTLENEAGQGTMNTFCQIGDFNSDGILDYALCGRNGSMAWLQNSGASETWTTHVIAQVQGQECGGSVYDLTGNGVPDIINGADHTHDEMSWWENPGDGSTPWKRHRIANTRLCQMHDTLIGPIKNDGVMYLVFTNQMAADHTGTTIFAVPIPEDPYQEPWPNLEIIAQGKHLPNPRHPWNSAGIQPDEGLAIADVNGDGLLEVVCGVSYYRWTDEGWASSQFTSKSYISNKIAVGDVNGDGRAEIVLSEGDACIYGHNEGCKLAYFTAPPNGVGEWEEHILDTGLLDAHSLRIADLCGNGFADLFVGEIGVVAKNGASEEYTIRPPRLLVYENDGKGHFTTRHIIDEGTGIHEAVLADLNGNGKLDIIGKPLHGPEKWSIHVWYRE